MYFPWIIDSYKLLLCVYSLHSTRLSAFVCFFLSLHNFNICLLQNYNTVIKFTSYFFVVVIFICICNSIARSAEAFRLVVSACSLGALQFRNGESATRTDASFETKKKRMVMGQRINYYFPIMHLKLHLQLRAVANSSGILYCIRRVEWIHPSRTLSTLQSKCQNVVRYGKFHAHVPSRPFCSVSHGDDFYRFRKISYLCLDNGNGHE